MLQFRHGLAVEAMQTDLLQPEMITKVAGAHMYIQMHPNRIK